MAAVEPPEQRGAEDPNTVGCLITRYLARPEFKTDLAPRMRKLFRGWSIDYCQSIVDVYLPHDSGVAIPCVCRGITCRISNRIVWYINKLWRALLDSNQRPTAWKG